MADESVLGGGQNDGVANPGGNPPPASGTGNLGSSGGNAGGSALGGETQKSWRDSLPEDIRNNASISSFQDIPSLTKAFIHAKSLVGKKGVIRPDDKATPEEWGNFYKEIGVPESDKYMITQPKDYEVDDGFLGKYKEVAAKNGLLPRQAQELLSWYAQMDKEAETHEKTERAKTVKEGLEGLRKEWGDAYDKELKSAEFAAKELGGEELRSWVASKDLREDPMLIKLLNKASKLMGEDRLHEGGVTDSSQTPSEIQREIDSLRASGDANGLFNKNHPMHFVTLSKIEALAKKLTNGR